MKRPLCYLFMILAVIVYIYLEIRSPYLSRDPYGHLDGKELTITGKITSKDYHLDYEGNKILVLCLIPDERMSDNSKFIQCYVSLDNNSKISIGERIMVSGKVKTFKSPTNPGEFDSRLYYSTLKTAYRMTNCQVLKKAGRENPYREGLFRLKTHFEGILDSCLSEKDSSIMKAVLLGDKAFMDDEVKKLYQNSGVVHILAVSGLHISVIAFGIYKALRKVNLRNSVCTVISLAFIYSYGTMCGMGVSAFRAILMFGLRLIAPLHKRTYDMLTGLALAGILLLLDQPLQIYNSGFLFSFGAIVGISFVYPALFPKEDMGDQRKMAFVPDKYEKLWGEIMEKLKSSIFIGLSIFLVTLPVYSSFYYKYSLGSMVLNLIVIPLMTPLLVLGIICLLLGCIFRKLSIIPAFLIHLILVFYRLLCNLSLEIPGGIWRFGHSAKWKMIIYLVLLFAILKLDMAKWLKTRRLREFKLAIALILVLFLTFRPGEKLQISMIDVGQGDGIYMEIGGKSYLIDGGSTSNKSVGKYSIIPYLNYEGVGTIEAVFVTHEDEDHISGILELMDDMEEGGIRVKKLFLPAVPENQQEENYKNLEKRAREVGITVDYLSCGQTLELHASPLLPNKKVKLECLNPNKNTRYESANAHSIVLFMEYGNFKALFTGDLEQEGESHLIKDIKQNPEKYRELTLLKVAHHGSRGATSEEFLRLVDPRIALISVGDRNKYGHPHKELLERLEESGARIYRTDESGMISITVKGEKIYIDEFCK